MRSQTRASSSSVARSPEANKGASACCSSSTHRAKRRSTAASPMIRGSTQNNSSPPASTRGTRSWAQNGSRCSALRLDLGPAVFEAECAVEDEPARRRVGIRAEVAEALELHGLADGQLRECRLDKRSREDRLRVGVDVREGVAVSAGIWAGEEAVVETDLGGHGLLGREPVQSCLGPAAVRGVAATRLRIVGAAKLDDLAACVLHHVGAGDEVGIAEAHLAARGEAEELARRVLHEIVALDPELAREGHLARPGREILRVVDCLELLDLGGAPALASHADDLQEVAETLGWKSAPAKRRDGGHPRIVPASDGARAHESGQDPLREHGVREIEARELVLARARRHRQVLDQPVVERPVILELERAEGVGDALDGVRLTVGEVVQRIDAPLVAGSRVSRVQDPVQHRVAHVDVGRSHVDPGPEHSGAVRKLTRAHALEQVEILIDRTVAPGAVLARLAEGAAVLADLVGGEVVDVGLAGLDQVDGPVVELMEVVRRVVEMLAPVEAEPADVLLDGVDVLLLFLDRVRVVEAQVAAPAELLGDPEVERDRLGMADVEVTVRLGREARHDRRDPAFTDVGGNDLADEIASFGRGWTVCARAAATHQLAEISPVRRRVWAARRTGDAAERWLVVGRETTKGGGLR